MYSIGLVNIAIFGKPDDYKLNYKTRLLIIRGLKWIKTCEFDPLSFTWEQARFVQSLVESGL